MTYSRQMQIDAEQEKHKLLAARNRERNLLQIAKFSGLKLPLNEALLDQLLGSALSLEALRILIEKKPEIAAQFEWATEPFEKLRKAEMAVSYTHLTLPTICSV